MNPKENFLASLKNQQHEWIPWAPLIDTANTPCFVPQKMKEHWDGVEIGLYLFHELGCDILLGSGLVDVKHKTAKQTIRTEGDLTTTEIQIAGKTLKTSTRRLNHNGQVSHAITEYLLKDEKDLEIYELLIDDMYLEYNTAEFEKMSKKLGDKGVVSVMAPSTPLMHIIINLMGIENFTFAFYDHPEIVDRLVEKIHVQNLKLYRMIASSGVDFDVVRMHEDQDILLTSPQTYRKYIMPLMKDYCDICHDAGKIFMMHACGHVKEFLPMIQESGIDAHHYLTNAPVGDTAPSVARKIWGDKINIMASVDPLLQAVGTKEEVRDDLISILNELQDSNFMIMSPLKPDIPEENIRMIQSVMQELRGM